MKGEEVEATSASGCFLELHFYGAALGQGWGEGRPQRRGNIKAGTAGEAGDRRQRPFGPAALPPLPPPPSTHLPLGCGGRCCGDLLGETRRGEPWGPGSLGTVLVQLWGLPSWALGTAPPAPRGRCSSVTGAPLGGPRIAWQVLGATSLTDPPGQVLRTERQEGLVAVWWPWPRLSSHFSGKSRCCGQRR